PALTVVGRGGHPRMPRVLRALAERSRVELVTSTNPSDDELADLHRSHALFVFAAHNEPFGLVILEALASGLPVVAVDEGGVRESVRHGQTGYLVKRSEVEFATAVERLLCDVALRSALGRAARVDVLANWTWESATRRLEEQLVNC